MDWMRWLSILSPLVSSIARAIIEGSRAAGVTHETVALTIAKTVLHISNGTLGQPPEPQGSAVPRDGLGTHGVGPMF